MHSRWRRFEIDAFKQWVGPRVTNVPQSATPGTLLGPCPGTLSGTATLMRLGGVPLVKLDSGCIPDVPQPIPAGTR